MTAADGLPAPAGLEPGPEADAWRTAADEGGARRRVAPTHPAWVPANASLSTELQAEIVAWARAGLPNEACGVLAANRTAEDGGTPTRFLPMRNAAASPYRYEMDSHELLRTILELEDADQLVWGIVHSHVASRAEPSATDVGLAAYQDALYVICSLASDEAVLRAWSIVDGRVSEVVLQPV